MKNEILGSCPVVCIYSTDEKGKVLYSYGDEAGPWEWETLSATAEQSVSDLFHQFAAGGKSYVFCQQVLHEILTRHMHYSSTETAADWFHCVHDTRCGSVSCSTHRARDCT